MTTQQKIIKNKSGLLELAQARHEYQLYLAIEDIDHTKIKAKSPQTNGICERFNRTVKNEFYDIAFRKKNLLFHRTTTARPRPVDERLQHPENTHRQALLW